MRARCFQIIFESLLNLNITADSTRGSTPFDVLSYRKQVHEMCFATSDVLFHYMLYDWLKLHRLTDELTKTKSPYTVQWMNLYAKQDIEYATLLWQHYAYVEEYMLAARQLYNIASSES